MDEKKFQNFHVSAKDYSKTCSCRTNAYNTHIMQYWKDKVTILEFENSQPNTPNEKQHCDVKYIEKFKWKTSFSNTLLMENK